MTDAELHDMGACGGAAAGCPYVPKLTPAQFKALNKLADGGGSNQMRRATNESLHKRGLMSQGQITKAGLKAIGRN